MEAFCEVWGFRVSSSKPTCRMRCWTKLALVVAMPRTRTVQGLFGFRGLERGLFRFIGVLGFEVSGLGFSGFGV